MELRLLRYFVAVAEELNFTRAAERLHIAQPSLSQQVRQLETEIGAPLFLRDKHRLELTEAGRIFLRESRNILNYTNHAISMTRQAARAEAGLITIAMVPGPEGKIFSRVLSNLLFNNPEVQIVLRSLTSPEQVAALQNREINVGLLRGPIDDEHIASEVIDREDVVAVLPANHRLAAKPDVTLRDLLAELPLIQVAHATAPTVHDTIQRLAESAGAPAHQRLEVESITAILSAVASGLGFGLHGAYVEQILPHNAVVRHLDLNPQPKLELLVAYRKDDRLPALAAFLQQLWAAVRS
jgi:LysR family hca operon transcriptional activator